MFPERITVALRDYGPDLVPLDGRLVAFNASLMAADALPKDRTHFVERHRPVWDQLQSAGYDVRLSPEKDYTLGIVCLPRSKLQARDLVASAAASTSGRLIIDGQKTNGIEGIIRAARSVAKVDAVINKAHGKLAVISSRDFSGWKAADLSVDGFVTRAGVFSADRIDPGSRLLAGTLSGKLRGCVADFGAGWGFLAKTVLSSDEVSHVDLVEADHVALDCARLNVASERAGFHWADVRTFDGEVRYDAVVMNPPFHVTRAEDTELGAAFIGSAARNLKRNGVLWMVANRHLPYEKVLATHFRNVHELGGDKSYKLFCAEGPRSHA